MHLKTDTTNRKILSFKYESKINSTELSNSIWGKKTEKINVDLDWSILNKAKTLFSSFKRMHVMSYREISHHFFYKECVQYTQRTGN